MISLVVVAMARYSASAEERDTTVCFFDLQEIGDDPRKMIYPVVDRRVVGHPAQSASQYACKDKELFAGSKIP